MNLIPEFPHKAPKGSLNAMLLQFGFIITVGLLTMAVVPLVLSGDSTTPKEKSITPQSIVRVLVSV